MNNEQFRRLLFDDASKPKNQKSSQSPKSHETSRGHGNATPAASALGSRLKSSIPMTPRTVGNIDFARQLSDYHREQNQPPSKRFKSSSAPKGTKLPSGYEDRAAKLRALEERGERGNDQTGDDGDGNKGPGTDLEKRITALEEMVKLGQINQATFEKLRAEMGVGGDVGSTHMVKGLDWELLRRVRAGEDVNAPRKEGEGDGEEGKKEEEKEEQEEDVDEAFDRVLEEKGEALPSAPKETEPKKKKKGNLAMAPPAAAPVPRTRDEILRQLRASRERARATEMAPPPPPAQPESVLGARFKKVGDDATKVEKKRWVEQDETGRRKEILQITDAQGNTKRKVRWLDKPGQSNGGLLAPDKDAKPLGMEVPVEIASKTAAPAEAEDEDDDIFAGVGADYNPLGDLDEEDSSSSDSEDDTSVDDKKANRKPSADADADADAQAVRDTTVPAVAPSDKPSRPRNYFSTSTSDEPESVDRSNPLTKDPTLLAALKRAAALRQASPSDEAAEGGDGDEGVDSDTLLRRKKFLEEARRREAQDAMDMDFGFGSSRIEDEEDEEGPTYDEQRGGKKRKRGPKKKKGDKDSASDVMQVLEGRKK